VPAFTAGRRVITTKRAREAAAAAASGGGADTYSQQQQHQHQHEQHHGGGGGGGRKSKLRFSIKDSRPISVNVASLVMAHPGAEEAGGAAMSHDTGSGETTVQLNAGTEQRRRVVEVRQRNARQAAQQERRAVSAVSGFNTKGGERRAQIVLPRNSAKMQAREQLIQLHPHIAQLFRGLAPPDVFDQQPFSRLLADSAPTAPYRRRNAEIKSVVQWHERRLFLYELEFLTTYGAIKPNTVVVYAGCAPGTRLSYLAELFPSVAFVLVDPTPLDVDEATHPNVRVRTEAFTDKLARELQAGAAAEDRTLLFISHATSDAPLGGLQEEYSTHSSFDASAMADAKRWYTLLKPAKALLRFSLPWTDDSSTYLDGDLLLPIWNPPTSTEVRILPNGGLRTWQHRHFEEQMFHFNTITRVGLHEHGVTAEGLDGCFDCSSEVYVLERYLERFPSMLSVALGSQKDVLPQSDKPATMLKLDTTKFNDPKWQERQRAREAARMPKLRIEVRRDDAELGEEEEPPMDAAEGKEDTMGDEAASAAAAAATAGEAASPAAAAAAAASPMDSNGAAAAAASSSSAMGDAAPAVELSAVDQLKLNVGKFSQELSRRLTKGGTRTLATVNAQVIKKAAFSRKNRM